MMHLEIEESTSRFIRKDDMKALSEYGLSNYDVTEAGVVISLLDSSCVHQMKSNGYRQVFVKLDSGQGAVLGVHQLVAMKYLNWYSGSHVHHLDKDRSNNHVSNLEVIDPKSHLSMHGKDQTPRKGFTPWNKGKKMSDEFREKCRQSALARHHNNR